MSNEAIHITSTKHQAHIEGITCNKIGEKSNGCTLKLTYSDQVPEELQSGVTTYQLPTRLGQLQMRANGKSICLSLESMKVTVNVATGVHTAVCKPTHSFCNKDILFLYGNRHASGEANEIEIEFIPSQREIFNDKEAVDAAD